MAVVADSNRPQPLWQPPPTACPTASGTAEVPSLRMHPSGSWVRALARDAYVVVFHQMSVRWTSRMKELARVQPTPQNVRRPLEPRQKPRLRRRRRPVGSGGSSQKRSAASRMTSRTTSTAPCDLSGLWGRLSRPLGFRDGGRPPEPPVTGQANGRELPPTAPGYWPVDRHQWPGKRRRFHAVG